MPSSDTPRRSARPATTDREHSFINGARRDARTAYPMQQGILPLPSSPSATAFTERRVTFSEQGEGSNTLSVQAAEFQPSANLPGPPATPLTNAVLARGEGTPFDDMATVVRGAPRSMTERQAGSRVLSVPQSNAAGGWDHAFHPHPQRRTANPIKFVYLQEEVTLEDTSVVNAPTFPIGVTRSAGRLTSGDSPTNLTATGAGYPHAYHASSIDRADFNRYGVAHLDAPPRDRRCQNTAGTNLLDDYGGNRLQPATAFDARRYRCRETAVRGPGQILPGSGYQFILTDF
ncbi:hypothetical protein CYMTET_39362 [Cymbomonas tetramitiformis]|uniref:Uncharacterized protein n=1 Tax=Cymbomonas tetramitiformis TaxID=36881 RepID=A0AAE0F4C1_9CHLO|nr:hypothetical protein CYMTET_39362 [Cymbomonas tetramitiformis]